MFNHYAGQMGIPQRITPHTTGTIGDIEALLDAGKPVIVHGYFTGYGHVIVLTGHTDTDFIVNDPAGTWNESFAGGFSSYCTGNGAKYNKNAFELAVTTSNGSTPDGQLWYHEITE